MRRQNPPELRSQRREHHSFELSADRLELPLQFGDHY